MTETVAKAKQDISPEWVELSNNVRKQAVVCLASHEEPGDHVRKLSQDTIALCDHVDRLHADLKSLLGVLESGEDQSPSNSPDDREIDLAAVESQRETHEKPSDALDILKALLMWRDDPAERLHRPD